MMHQSTEQNSAQGTNSSISKLIIAPETGNANIALQPGTPFLLQGCMCQEGDGVIVVKVNWRDKTYTGSLMDMEQYPWATPKHVEIAELGSPLDKKHRFSPRLLPNQTKHNTISQELEEQQPKENDIVMSPQSSDLVESEEGRSPDTSKQILPRLSNCTELNKTNLMSSFMDIDRGFRSKQTLGLLSSPSNSLTDLKAEGEKKKNHEMHTGMAHPKEVVIQNILGDGNVLPFDTSNREKVKFEMDVKEELREDLPSRQMVASTKRAPEILLSNQQQRKEGFAPARPMMSQIPFSGLSSLPHTPHLDLKPKLVKPIPEKMITLADQLHHFPGAERMHKSDSISPKSSTPDSPNDQKPQKKRKHDNNHDNSTPKRPDSLIINNNNSTDHLLSYIPDKMSIRVDDSTNIRSHIPVNKSSSASHQPLSSNPSTHTPKPHPDRKPNLPAEYLITTEVFSGNKFSRDNGRERQDKHNLYVQPQVVPHGFPSMRDKIVRMEKKPKRTREGQSPSDHNMDVSKANHPAFLPAPSDTKVGSLTTPNIKIEAQPPTYIAPEFLPYYFPSLYLQGAAGIPTMPVLAEQQKMLQANFQEVKVENEKAKQKTSNAHKSKSHPKQQQHLDFSNYFQQHLPINPQLLAQNPIALMMNQHVPLSMLSKDPTVQGGLAIPGYPVMVEQDKDKVRHSLSQPIKQKVTTPSSVHSNSNSNRRLIEKPQNHETQEELTHNIYSQDYIKLNNAQQHLLRHPDLSNNIDQTNHGAINLTQTFKHKSLATTTNNNKLTNVNPTLAVLNSNQAKNGIYPYPFVMTPDLQQMSLFPNIPFHPSIDPSSIHLQMPYFDPVAMRLSQAQVQPDTLDSKCQFHFSNWDKESRQCYINGKCGSVKSLHPSICEQF